MAATRRSASSRGFAARRFRQRQRQVACKVAVFAFARALHENGGRDVRWQVSVFLQSGDGTGEDLGNLFFHGWFTAFSGINADNGIPNAGDFSCKGFVSNSWRCP